MQVGNNNKRFEKKENEEVFCTQGASEANKPSTVAVLVGRAVKGCGAGVRGP